MTTSQKPKRLHGLDLARFIAFAGMVIVNFRVVMGAENDGGVFGLLSGALEGRAAATFVVLAGVGLGLAAMRGDYARAVTVTIKRAVFLLALGLVNALVFEADILHYYAFYFLFGVALMRWPSRRLVTAMVMLNVCFLLMVLTLDYETGWNWADYTYADFWTPTGFVRNLFFNGWHPVVPWLGFLLLGFVLSRMPLSEVSTQNRLVFSGVVAVAVAEVGSVLLVSPLNAISPELVVFATTKPVPPMPLYSMAGSGFAAATIGLCLRFSGLFERSGVLRIVTPAGRQTLTLYIAHIFVGMGTLEALGWLGGQSAARAVAAALVFCVIAVLYALLWSRYFRRGPIEALMRRLAS